MDSYNYSSLQAAYRCNQYFKYLYVDKLKPVSQPDADLTFGSAMHFAMEQFFVEKLPLIDSFKIYWTSEASKVKYGRNDQETLESNAEILLERFERLHAKKIKIHEAERRLYGTLRGLNSSDPGIKVEGTPDLLGDFGGLRSVIDFKTAAYRYPKEKIRLNEQMYLYAHLAAQNGYEAEQIVYLVFIKGKTPSIQTLTRKIDKAEMQKVLDNVYLQCENLNKLQESGKYSYNSNSCQQGERKCPFFDKCWKKETEDET